MTGYVIWDVVCGMEEVDGYVKHSVFGIGGYTFGYRLNEGVAWASEESICRREDEP